jgi:hypothetical protein
MTMSRAPMPSFSGIPTEVITLSPELIAALRAIAPKPKSRAPLLGLVTLALAALVWVGLPSQAREVLVAKAGSPWHRAPPAVAATTAVAPPAPTVATPPVVRSSVEATPAPKAALPSAVVATSTVASRAPKRSTPWRGHGSAKSR